MITMLKKLLIILNLFILVGCSSSREDYYILSFNNESIAVGYDDVNDVDTSLLDSFSTISNKDKNIVSSITVYTSDVGDIYLNGTILNKGIKETCDVLNGEYGEKNGHVCLLSKRVHGHNNYILLYSDILSDDLDKIDHIVVEYK